MRPIRLRSSLRRAIGLLVGALVLTTSGCTLTLSPLAKHTAEFSNATAVVVEGSKNAYTTANRLYQSQQIDAAIDAYDTPGWSPYTATMPLLTPDQVAARVKLLDGLRAYAQFLDGLTETKTRNGRLDDAASSAGANLQSLTGPGGSRLKALFPGLEKSGALDSQAVSTEIDGLGRLLTDARAKRALAQTTSTMDATITAMCDLLESDADTLRKQADVDYRTEIGNLNQFIQHNRLDPAMKRDRIAKLIEMAQQQKVNDDLLAKLEQALSALAKAHTALSSAAAGRDPEAIEQRLRELISFGTELGSYYQSMAVASN